MNRDEITQFIRDNRAVAQAQAQRWEGVDPSRLLRALDYLEQLLGQERQTEASVKTYVESTVNAAQALADVASLRNIIDMPVYSLSMQPDDIYTQGVNVTIELTKMVDIPTAEQIYAAFRDHAKARLLL